VLFSIVKMNKKKSKKPERHAGNLLKYICLIVLVNCIDRATDLHEAEVRSVTIRMGVMIGLCYVYCRASFDTSVPGGKRKCLNEGEEPEEDVEEQRVSEH